MAGSSPSTRSPSTSMERAVADAQRMRSEMAAALEKEYGPPRWGLAANQQPLIERSACEDGEDPDGETAFLPNWGTSGDYPKESWRGAARLVEEIGRKYGFDRVTTVVDRAQELDIDGRSPDGGQYTFGFAPRGGLTVATGCHVWDDKPQGLVRDTES